MCFYLPQSLGNWTIIPALVVHCFPLESDIYVSYMSITSQWNWKKKKEIEDQDIPQLAQ